MNPLSKELFIS